MNTPTPTQFREFICPKASVFQTFATTLAASFVFLLASGCGSVETGANQYGDEVKQALASSNSANRDPKDDAEGVRQRLNKQAKQANRTRKNRSKDSRQSMTTKGKLASGISTLAKNAKSPDPGGPGNFSGKLVRTKEGELIRVAKDPLKNKTITLVMMAAEGDVRAANAYSFAREWLTDRQIARAEALSATFDDEYLELLRRRAEILENAKDGEDVQARVNEIYEESLELTEKLRKQIRYKILTPKQREEIQAFYQRKNGKVKEIKEGKQPKKNSKPQVTKAKSSQ